MRLYSVCRRDEEKQQCQRIGEKPGVLGQFGGPDPGPGNAQGFANKLERIDIRLVGELMPELIETNQSRRQQQPAEGQPSPGEEA